MVGRGAKGLALELLIAISALLVPGFAAAADKAEAVVSQGSPFSFDFGFSPKTLPRSESTPVTLKLGTRFTSPTGSPHPPPAKRVTLLLDRSLGLSTQGLASCSSGRLLGRSKLPKHCKRALVGKGRMETSIVFPGSTELRQRANVLLVNGGTRGNSTRLWLDALITTPVPATVLTPLDFKRVRHGRFALKGVLAVPMVAGGAGSLVSLALTIHRKYRFKGKAHSVVTLSCPDGKVAANAEAAFADGSPSISDDLARPCTGRS